MINEDKKSRGQEDKQETNNPSPLVGEGRVRGYYGLPRFARNDEKTCHPERRIDLRVSGSHNYETLKQAPTSILPHKGGSISPSLEGRLGWVPIKSAVVKSSKKVAFTLAEVLITLGIIGIVAAMTMPALIQKHQKKVAIVRLKEAYSVLSQAIKLAEVANGESKYWTNLYMQDTDNQNHISDFAENYVVPYIKCEKLGLIAPLQDLPNLTYYRNLNKSIYADIMYVSSYVIRLNNGQDIFMSWNTYMGKYREVFFNIDVNGMRKKPNVVGKDTFLFALDLNRGIIYPYGNPNACLNGDSRQCASKIIQDGWEIKDDYPW